MINQKTKEEIRESIIPISLFIIAITIFITQTIIVKTPIQKINPEINLTEECNKICQAKGLILATIDEAGIGYTTHKTSGRCICLNTSEIK